MSRSERKKEIQRRRHRKKKLSVFERKLRSATSSDKQAIASKLRMLTAGAEEIIKRLELGVRG
jgi:hypothetical protein